MTAQILNGKILASEIRSELKSRIATLREHPHLAIILVGHNEASSLYVRNKRKAAEETGIDTTLFQLDEDVNETELLALINKLNTDSQVNGIMIQLPLPKHLDTPKILNSVLPIKDVDGFHPCNIGLLQNNDPAAVVAATPKGIMRLLKTAQINLEGKNALVIGRSQIVGKPMAMLLLNNDCTVTIAHSHTQNLPQLIAQADILIAACGCPELIKGKDLKENAILIDVGINHVNGRLCGDVDFETAKEKVSYITPVPGGVGPMTVAMLLENTFEAYIKQNA